MYTRHHRSCLSHRQMLHVQRKYQSVSVLCFMHVKRALLPFTLNRRAHSNLRTTQKGKTAAYKIENALKAFLNTTHLLISTAISIQTAAIINIVNTGRIFWIKINPECQSRTRCDSEINKSHFWKTELEYFWWNLMVDNAYKWKST